MTSIPQTRTEPIDRPVPPRLRPVVRAFWLAIALSLLAAFIAGVPLHYSELAQTCDGDDCIVLVLTSAESEMLGNLGLSRQFYASYLVFAEIFLALVFGLLALLIFWRRSDTWLSVALSLSLLFFGYIIFTEEFRALARVHPAIHQIDAALTACAILFFILPFYIFPDGRFVPCWTRNLLLICGAILVVDAILPITGVQAASASMVAISATFTSVVVGLATQIYRFRHVSAPAQRQQTKWVTFGFVCLFVATIFWTIFAELFPLAPGPTRLLFALSLPVQDLLISLFPISIAVSILRYRLWDIDVIIRRTLLYSSITVLLLLVYFGSIVLLQQVLHLFTKQDSAIVIVLSTLLIAALFNPLRRRVQEMIDRRFFRKKYNAEQVLAQFALTARDETDLDQLSSELIRVVDETMQSEQVSVWLKSQPKTTEL